MAYMSQEKKAALATGIKAVLKKYKMKGSIAVSNYSTLVVNLREGDLDLIGAENKRRAADAKWKGENAYLITDGYLQVNTYWAAERHAQYGNEKIAKFYEELVAAMNGSADGAVENHDNSDIMTDYFDVGWYVNINVGKWNKPYNFTGKKEEVAA